jgi:hypothetical protein
MKTLLAVGCSFTNKNYKSDEHPEMDCSWPKWPEIVGKKLGYEVVNLGTNGHSNDNIMRSVQDYLAYYKVDMVCALWTEPFRLNIHDTYHANWYAYLRRDVRSITGSKRKAVKTSHLNASKPLVDHIELVKRLCRTNDHTHVASEELRHIHTLDIIAKSHNIPVYHMHGCSLWKNHVYETASVVLGDNITQKEKNQKFKLWLRAFVYSPYFNILDKQTNIWGWPFYEEIGGELPLGNRDHRISEIDSHPNAKGQQILADKYLELIEQNATN